MHHRARHAPRGSWSAAGVAVLTIAGVLLTSSCSLGDKARLEERITSAPARYEGMVVSGTMTVESRLTKVPAGARALGAGLGGAPGEPSEFPKEGVSLGVLGVGFALDLATSRATLNSDPAAPTPGAAVLFDDLVYYGRRGGVPADDARPWVRLDLDELDDTAGELDPMDGAGVTAIYALHPAVLVDLVAGSLTGSIEPRDGAAALEGATARYDVNVSVRKALNDARRSRYPERRRESVEELLRLLGVVGDLHPGEVWLDVDGRIRRFRIEFRQEPQRKVEFRMIVSLDIAPAPSDPSGGEPESFRPPAVDEVLSVDSVVRFMTTVVAPGGGP